MIFPPRQSADRDRDGKTVVQQEAEIRDPGVATFRQSSLLFCLLDFRILLFSGSGSGTPRDIPFPFPGFIRRNVAKPSWYLIDTVCYELRSRSRDALSNTYPSRRHMTPTVVRPEPSWSQLTMIQKSPPFWSKFELAHWALDLHVPIRPGLDFGFATPRAVGQHSPTECSSRHCVFAVGPLSGDFLFERHLI